MKKAATDAFFEIIENRRADWTKTVSELGEEMDALHRRIESQQKIIAAQPKQYSPEEYAGGLNRQDRRVVAQTDIAIREERDYREYLQSFVKFIVAHKRKFQSEKDQDRRLHRQRRDGRKQFGLSIAKLHCRFVAGMV